MSVYNLEFPEYMHNLSIAGYEFKRIPAYKEAYMGLQHTVHVIGTEFDQIPCTGTHQLTAIVTTPKVQESCILPWGKNKNYTKLLDVLLLLSLFTGRNVFTVEKDEENLPLRPDPRHQFWGGQLRLSMRRNVKYKNKKSGAIISEEDMKGNPVWDFHRLDFGLEDTINELLSTIKTEKWRETYDTGFFIFTFHQAVRQDQIQPAFLLCWTIWEHLFTLHNKQWLDSNSIEQTSGDKKIAYILNKYLLINIDDTARKEIKRIAGARNRLIHFGMIPENVDWKEMEMFIRLTEQIMAIILNLKPSNAFNSFEELETFLKKKTKV